MGSVIETCTALGVSLHLNHLILVKIVKIAESPDSSSNVPKGRSVWCEVHGDRHQRHKVWQKKSAPLRWNGSDIDLPLVSPFWVILDILGSLQRWEVIQPSIDQLGCACEASNLREKFSSQRLAVCDESVRWHLRLRQHLSFVRWNTLQSHTKPLLLPWSLLLEYLPLCDLPRAGDTSKCRGREQRKCQAVHSQWPGTLKQKRQVLKYLLIVAKFCNLFSAN
jgi:hypothetical protein